METFLISVVIWIVSAITVALYLQAAKKEETAGRVGIALCPCINTIFAAVVMAYGIKSGIKTFIKELKEIKGDLK